MIRKYQFVNWLSELKPFYDFISITLKKDGTLPLASILSDYSGFCHTSSYTRFARLPLSASLNLGLIRHFSVGMLLFSIHSVWGFVGFRPIGGLGSPPLLTWHASLDFLYVVLVLLGWKILPPSKTGGYILTRRRLL